MIRKKSRNNLITVQKNELIRNSIYKYLDITDLKILKLIFSKINSKSTLFDEFYIITYEELDMINIVSKNRYEHVMDSLKKLAAFFIEVSNEDEITTFGLIQNKFIFKKYTKKIVISIHNDLQEFLLDIKSNFTQYEIEQIHKLTTKYELKLYEFLKSYESLLEIEVTIEKLRNVLEMNNEYKLYSNMKQRVLLKSIDKINDYTDINIEMKEIKTGKKITSLLFQITPNMNSKNKKDIKKLEEQLKSFKGKRFKIRDIEFIIFDIEKIKHDTYSLVLLDDKGVKLKERKTYTSSQLMKFLKSKTKK